MMNPYILLALLVAWLGSLVAVGYWQRTDGIEITQAAWKAREVKEVTQATTAIQKQLTAARESEQLHMAQLTCISSAYQQEISNVQTQHAKDVAAVRAGYRLRDTGGSATVQPCPDPGAQAAPSPGGRDGAAGCELSGQVTGDLYALADDADATVKQLSACQQVVRADRN